MVISKKYALNLLRLNLAEHVDYIEFQGAVYAQIKIFALRSKVFFKILNSCQGE